MKSKHFIPTLTIATLFLTSLFTNLPSASTTTQHYWAYGFIISTAGRHLPCWEFYNPVEYSNLCLPRYLKIIKVSDNPNATADIYGSEAQNGITYPDGGVDMIDLYFVSGKYGCEEWDDDWDYQGDINDDKRIDMVDLYVVTKRFGQQISWTDFNPSLDLLVQFIGEESYFDGIPDSNGVVEIPYNIAPEKYNIRVAKYIGEGCILLVNAFVLVDFGEVYPSWADPSFSEHNLDTIDSDGVWHPMLGDNGILWYDIHWNQTNGSMFLGVEALGDQYLGTMSGASILSGKMNAQTCTSLNYPYTFYGKFGHATNYGEAIIYYDEIPPLYINIDVKLVERCAFSVPGTIRPPKITSGLVLMGWIEEFNDYDDPSTHVDQFVTIEPQWLHLRSESVGDSGWVEDGFPPLICSCYSDSSYHYIEQRKPKLYWQTGERLQFSINMSAIIKRMFEYDWSNAYDVCFWYGLPYPEVLAGKRLIDVTDHIYIYAIYPYVEVFWARLQMEFYEISITNKPKFDNVVGS